MADRLGVEAVGLSVMRLLNQCLEEEQPLGDNNRAKAVLMRTEDFDVANHIGDLTPPMVSFFLYRVDINRVTRPAWSAVANQDGRIHLPLDLHFLLTPWAENAEFEYRLLGFAMACLERIPILSGPLLYPSADWRPQEALQLSIPEITTEDLMRTFDSLPGDYKLSIPYLARIVRIEQQDSRQDVPIHHVVTGSKPELTQ